MSTNSNHKRVRITKCVGKLEFVKAIKDVTGKSLLESKNIADSLISNNKSCGTLLLNEASITPSQWGKMLSNPSFIHAEVEWHYV